VVLTSVVGTQRMNVKCASKLHTNKGARQQLLLGHLEPMIVLRVILSVRRADQRSVILRLSFRCGGLRLAANPPLRS
jgi:hypothetical protein